MKTEQASLFDFDIDLSDWTVTQFSAHSFAEDLERKNLESKFIQKTTISDEFNRQSVSYQLSKKDCIHRWLKYKEGFSADLVQKLLTELSVNEGDVVLDPFMGSGTTALVCKLNNINSIGYDILPMTKISITAKDAVLDYNIEELLNLQKEFLAICVPNNFCKKFQYISITEGAFPDISARQVVYYLDWIKESNFSSLAKNLFILCLMNSLENASYTRKDGQYLAWDSRSPKIIRANELRAQRGAKPINRLDKGEIPELKTVLSAELKNVIDDIVLLQRELKLHHTFINFKEGSSLLEIPLLEDNSVDGVITSPPYCNRYDYTRTYALEMNFLGLSSQKINQLRQDLISCTVENKSKINFLREYYTKLDRLAHFEKVVGVLKNCGPLNEIIQALNKRNLNGEINNKGVLRMVEGYFVDLAFIYSEIFRVFKPGAKIAVVNDNVRYAGEVIPVDFLSCEIAELLGFNIVKIYTLKQKKGNSSQQMAKYGRVPLRKSITIWEKPLH